jgi:hypothetical protein
MQLHKLQDKLILNMRDMYVEITDTLRSSARSSSQVQIDANIAQAFRHLNSYCAKQSHAERFLVCYIGSFAIDEKILRAQLGRYDFGSDVSEDITEEARAQASGRNWIVDDVSRFLLACEDDDHLPMYRKPDVWGPPREVRPGVGRVRRGASSSAAAASSAAAQEQGGHVFTATATATATAMGNGIHAVSAQANAGVSLAGEYSSRPFYSNDSDASGISDTPDPNPIQTRHSRPSPSIPYSHRHSHSSASASASTHHNLKPNVDRSVPLRIQRTSTNRSPPSSRYPSAPSLPTSRRGRSSVPESDHYRGYKAKEEEIEAKYFGLVCLFNGRFFRGAGSAREREQEREEEKEGERQRLREERGRRRGGR